MLAVIRSWFQKRFSDPEAILLVFLLIGGFLLVLGTGHMLTPLFASIIIAYFLQWSVNSLSTRKVPPLLAVIIVYVGFLGLFFGALLVLWPLMWRQTINLVKEWPNILKQAQELLYLLPQKFPEFITKETIDSLTAGALRQTSDFGANLLSASIASIPNLIALCIYLVLVPLMVFFFLKDKQKIIDWCTDFLPAKRPLLTQVWQEVDVQIGNYVRGKVVEVLIVGAVTFVTFTWFKLQYALLLASLVGLSVLVPYVGAVIVTIPVVLVAFFQWGLGNEALYVIAAYGVIQALDGNVLVPLLFSEAVNLHPVAILVAILFFGGLWGIWGVFFAIPLATLFKAVLNAWPVKQDTQ